MAALTAQGRLGVLISEDDGGAGLGTTKAAIVLEEITRSRGHGTVCDAQMYTIGALLRHRSEELLGMPRSC